MSCVDRPATAALEARLGHRFGDPDLLDRALTHRSAAHEAGDRRDSNEALEFLGDAVLGFVVTGFIWSAHPGATEGEMSRRRAALVSRTSLAKLARRLELGPVLRLGRGEAAGGGREKDSLLADALEAVLGALYLDGGLAPAAELLHRLLGRPAAAGGPDAKSALQARLQAGCGEPPLYRVVETSGPPHRPCYRIEVVHGGKVLGWGQGPTKKAAEQAAAGRALKRLPAPGWAQGERSSIASK
ncbi:MAG: ribonuclease III [Acidobacteriota bacterium]